MYLRRGDKGRATLNGSINRVSQSKHLGRAGADARPGLFILLGSQQLLLEECPRCFKRTVLPVARVCCAIGF